MLTGKQRSYLRSLGNDLEPILIVGKAGITENVIEQLEQALSARELVKSRVLPHTEFEVKDIGEALAKHTGSDLVQVIGRNMLFYRAPLPGKSCKINWPGDI